MAVEKRSQSNSQSIVDQDAAITAYLDGLLRDPEQDEMAEPSRSRKTPGLKVIAPEASEPAAEESDVGADESSTPAEPEVLADEPAGSREARDEVVAEETMEAAGESLTEQGDQTGVASDDETEAVAEESALEESPSPALDDQAEPDDSVAVATDSSAVEPEVVTEVAAAEEEAAVAPEASGEGVASLETGAESPTETSPWAWLRVGGMILAIPAEAVVSRYADAALEPVPGAPAQVAGALSVDGRPRLILSLASVTGARARGDAAEVLLLGTGGLWGVAGEPVDQPPAFDADAVQWRSESQRAERRGWLAGTMPSAGVAILDVAGLRAALKGSR